jgi:beta-phosphoglucomutase-like phosphatase (HAD superfamily)
MSAARAMLWDMDGTLIDSEEFHWISWRDTMANEGIAITREQFLSSFGQRNDSIIPRWLGPPQPPSALRKSQTPKRNCNAAWFATMGSPRYPVLPTG